MSREFDKKYYQENRAAICKKKREYYRKHHEKELRRVKKYQKENKEKILEGKRGYYKGNVVRILEVAKKYRVTEAYRKTHEKYRHSPKGMFTDRELHNRRRIVKNKGSLTQQQWDEILRKYNFRCAYCGIKGNMTIDHIIPISKNGKHVVENIAPACVKCNSRKGARTGWFPKVFKIAIGEENE